MFCSVSIITQFPSLERVSWHQRPQTPPSRLPGSAPVALALSFDHLPPFSSHHSFSAQMYFIHRPFTVESANFIFPQEKYLYFLFVKYIWWIHFFLFHCKIPWRMKCVEKYQEFWSPFCLREWRSPQDCRLISQAFFALEKTNQHTNETKRHPSQLAVGYISKSHWKWNLNISSPFF